MSTYDEWNTAIITHVTQGLSIGAHVFMSIDAATLDLIGLTIDAARPVGGWLQDFRRAVRSRCVVSDQIYLARFTRPSLRDAQNRPRYAAFLAMMVLAAHAMGDEHPDQPIDSTNYFIHFNRLLDLPDQQGRTKGLDPSDDEWLWQDWNTWLRRQGYLPTARPGTGAYKYIRYPISQTLLRQSDKKKLWRHFTDKNWRKNYDEVFVLQRLRREAQSLTIHLQALFDPKGDMWLHSHTAISNACYEVYEEWRESDGAEANITTSEPRLRTTLDAKIYRTEDFFAGTVNYFVFPRQVQQAVHADLSVEFDGQSYPLAEDRPGWYMPLWPLDAEQLNQGIKAPISSANAAITTLYLPAREFWVLTLDPHTPESGIYASWDTGIDLGTEFMLLVQARLRSDLATLRDEGLLKWQTVDEVFADWYEYRGVTILAEPDAWSSLNLGNETLRLTLQPHTAFSINLVGGLRAPRGDGWLIDHAPQISVAASLPEAELAVFDEAEECSYSATIEPGQLMDVPFTQPGNYRVVVEQGGQVDEKIVRIIDWQDLVPRLIDFDQLAEKLDLTIYGALVRE